MTHKDKNALLRGIAQESEPRVQHHCTMGVDCEEFGVCYAAAHGRPEDCGHPDGPYLERKRIEADHGDQ